MYKKIYRNVVIWALLWIVIVASNLFFELGISYLFPYMIALVGFIYPLYRIVGIGWFLVAFFAVLTSLPVIVMSIYIGPFISVYTYSVLSFAWLNAWLISDWKKTLAFLIVFFPIVYLLPQYDTFIVRYYFNKHIKSGESLEKITRTVEYPESVYWEDNVKSKLVGIDGRELSYFIEKTLDGIHLKKLAVNGKNGKIYLYTASKKQSPDIYESEKSLPPMKYKVQFETVILPKFEGHFIHSDIIKIIDNETKESIAYSKRYLSYKPFLTRVTTGIVHVGESPFYNGMRLQGEFPGYDLDGKVIFYYLKK